MGEAKDNIVELAAESVDLAAVNGLVDGTRKRINADMLLEIAMDGDRVTAQERAAFNRVLPWDKRYIDHEYYDYAFERKVRKGSNVRPALLGIIGGTALFTPEEGREALVKVDRWTQLVLDSEIGQDGIVKTADMRKTIRETDPSLHHLDHLGFLKYLSLDPRFLFLGDGRVVLTEKYGLGNEYEPPAEPLPNVQALADAVMTRMKTSQEGMFQNASVLKKLKDMRVRVPGRQLAELLEAIASRPDVETVKPAVYKLTSAGQQWQQRQAAPSRTATRNPAVIQARIEDALGSSRQVRTGRRFDTR